MDGERPATARVGATTAAEAVIGHPTGSALSAASTASAAPKAWLGIIDDGCPFAHQRFRDHDSGASRVEYLWDQNPVEAEENTDEWPASTRLGYGRECRPSRLTASGDDEVDFYSRLRYARPLESRASHGARVMDLAAGFPPPLARQLDASTPLEADEAGALPIVFVELPHIDKRETCCSTLGVHVLDALRYMIDRVERHAPPDGARDPRTRLVVNLSYGSLAGPHDGTSILEEAMDELIEKRGNLAIVLAAGNTFEVPEPSRPTHASLEVWPGAVASPGWRVQPADTTDSYLELWYRGGAAPGAVRVHVTPPGGKAQVVNVGESRA